MYGNICTNEYYLRAIAYMREKIENPTFFFISDDIEWVAKQNWVKDGIYIRADSFKGTRTGMIWQSCHWQGIILLQIVLSAGGGRG